MNDEEKKIWTVSSWPVSSAEVDTLLDFQGYLHLKGKLTPLGCNIVLDIIDYKIDLPQVEECD